MVSTTARIPCVPFWRMPRQAKQSPTRYSATRAGAGEECCSPGGRHASASIRKITDGLRHVIRRSGGRTA